MDELPSPAPAPAVAVAPAVASSDEMMKLKKENKRLNATFSGFMQENEELQSELEECHRQLKELQGRPVVRAEVEVESPAVQAVQALEPEPQMEDPKTKGWVKFKGATTKFGSAGDAPMEWVVSDIDGLPTAIAMRGVPKTGDKYIELTKKYTIHPCPHSGFECRQRGHGHKPNCYYPGPAGAPPTPDEFLMAIDGMRAITPSGAGIEGWIPRVPNVEDYDVYVKPGVSLKILAAKILELKGPREYYSPSHRSPTRKYTFLDGHLKIVVENEEDRAYLEEINPEISGLISQTGGYMKSKRRKKKTKRRKKKTKRRKKKTKRRKK